MKVIDIAGIQKIESRIVKQTFLIAQNNSIPAFMVCGSALGVIRHHGPIPWDDDVDIGVPFDRYVDFIKVLKRDLPTSYCCIMPGDITSYQLLFARVGIVDVDLEGIHVDIFPIVGLPNDKEKQAQFSKMSDKLNKIYFWKHFMLPKRKRGAVVAAVKQAAATLIRFSHVVLSNKRLIKKFYDHCAEYPYCDAEYVMNACGHYGLKNIVPRAYFGTPVMSDYAGMQVPIPEMTHEYLTHYYKNYMRLPPKEQTDPLIKKTVSVTDDVYEVLCKLQ